MPTARRTRGPVPLDPLRVGPWASVRKSSDPFEENTTTLYDAANVFGVDTPNGSGWSQRPPFVTTITSLGNVAGLAIATEAGVDLSTESGETILGDGASGVTLIGQCVYEHTRLDGTVDRLLFVSGRICRWDGATSYADITPSTVTIDAASRIFCASFADRVIVTDGVNRPFIFDPNLLTATTIAYNAADDAWCAFGPPVVYGAKVFFILESVASVVARTTITWSEENSPSTGYFQTDFDNTWTLSQTASDPLYCLIATNVALFYFRARSIGAISGVVNATFQTTSTLDAISNAVGTTTPASVVRTSSHLWFLDEVGRPHRFAIGSNAIEELWLQMRDDISSSLTKTASTLTVVSACMASYQPDTRHVLFALFPQAGTTPIRPAALYAFKEDSGAYHGVWVWGMGGFGPTSPDLAPIDAVAPMRDSNGRYTIALLVQRNPADATTRGSLLRQRARYEASAYSGIAWIDDDTAASGGVTHPVPSSIVSGQVGGDVGDPERLFDRMSARVLPPVGSTAIRTFELSVTTPRSGTSVPVTAIAPAPSGAGDDGHVTFGLLQRGRWARFGLTTAANTSTQPVVFDSMTVTSFVDAADPEIP